MCITPKALRHVHTTTISRPTFKDEQTEPQICWSDLAKGMYRVRSGRTGIQTQSVSKALFHFVLFCLIIPQFYVRVVRQCQRSTTPSLWDRPGTCCFDFLSASLSFYSFEAQISTACLQMIWLKPSSLQSQLNHSFLYVVPAHLAGFWESRFLVHLSYVLWVLTSILGHFLLATGVTYT